MRSAVGCWRQCGLRGGLCAPRCSPRHARPRRQCRALARVTTCCGWDSPPGILQRVEVIVSRINHVSFFPSVMSIWVMEHVSILGNFN